MDVDDAVELRFGSFSERSAECMAGVVDEEIETIAAPVSQRASDFGDELVEGGGIAGIEAKCGGFSCHGFGFADEAFGFLLIRAVGEDEIDAVAGEIDGGVAAEPAAGAGDDGDLAGHAFA